MDSESKEVVKDVDVIKEEEKMEDEEYTKRLHKDIKKWYGNQPELLEKCGKYPLFWQDLKEWEYWAEVKSLYEKSTEKGDDNKLERGKRSRWADATDRLKRSRWEMVTRHIQPGLSVAVASGVISIEQVQEIQLRVRVRDLTTRLQGVDEEAQRISNDPNKSPSPPPVYDSMGNRMNTRAIRMKRSIEEERKEIVEEILLLNPLLKQSQPKGKIQRIVFIPQDKYPDYNFLGLILGPRGTYHRKMELQTHTKIVIRGKGAGREARLGVECASQEEPLHVIITGEEEEGVLDAERQIKDLCIPKDDQTNERKQSQMRELALINGQLIDGIYCSICGEKGHNQFNCPNRPRSFTPANIQCAICGEVSHLTRDCPLRFNQNKIQETMNINSAYLAFMNELEGKDAKSDIPPAPPAPSAPPSAISDETSRLPLSPIVPIVPMVPMVSQSSTEPQDMQMDDDELQPSISPIPPQPMPAMPAMPQQMLPMYPMQNPFMPNLSSLSGSLPDVSSLMQNSYAMPPMLMMPGINYGVMPPQGYMNQAMMMQTQQMMMNGGYGMNPQASMPPPNGTHHR